MKIAVLFGGNSSERDVSIASGIQVTKALKEAGHNVLAVETFRGVLSDAEEQSLLSKGVAPEPPSTHDLEVIKAKTGGIVQPSYFTDADVVFLALHGGTGEDGAGQDGGGEWRAHGVRGRWLSTMNRIVAISRLTTA